MNDIKESNPSMTALMSCFIKAYHGKNGGIKVFEDFLSEKLLSAYEYHCISQNLVDGISFFDPGFKGSLEDTLTHIVNTYLGASVVGRSAFTERSLKTAERLGVSQYLIFASGYDTSGYRHADMKVFELDKSHMLSDKIRRIAACNINNSNVAYVESDFTNSLWKSNLTASGYDAECIAFCSLLGISYYLSIEDFSVFIRDISSMLSPGSTIVFDYPTTDDNLHINIKEKMARNAGEQMLSKYSYEDIESILERAGMLIYEHLGARDIEHHFFSLYNSVHKVHPFKVPEDVAYCLAVKRY